MKKIILVLAVVGMSTLNYAGKTFNSAFEYADFLNGHHDRVEIMFKETHQFFKGADTDVNAVIASFVKVQDQCMKSIDEITNANVYLNGNEFQANCIQLLCIYGEFGEKVMYDWLAVITNPNSTAEQYEYSFKIQDDYYDALMLAAIDFDYAHIDYEDSNVDG